MPPSRLDLTEAMTAILAAVNADGTPHLTAVAFSYDPGDGYRTLEVRVDVELEPEEDFTFAAIARRGTGTTSTTMTNLGRPRSIVTFHPRRIVARI